MKDRTQKDILFKATYYCLIALLFIVPVFVTTFNGNPFLISKNNSLKVLGGIFYVFTALLLINKTGNKKIKIHGLIIDKEVDPYVTFFILSAVISTIFSISPLVSYSGYYLRPLGLEIYLYTFLIYLLSSMIIQNKSKAKTILNFMELCAVMVSIYSLLQFAGFDFLKIQPETDHRPFGTFGNSVFLGGFLILGVPLSVSRIIEKRKLNYSVLSPVIIITTIVISQTRSAYAAVIIQLIIFLFSYPYVFKSGKSGMIKGFKISLIILGSVVLILVTMILFNRTNVYVNRFINITAIFENARWFLWRDSLKVFLQYPVSGCGLGLFPNVFENVYTVEFKLHDVRGFYDHAHSNFIHTLCTMGFIGIIAYVLLLGHTVFILIRTLNSRILKPEKKILYIGFLAMVGGYIVFGIADFDETSILFYFIMYLAILKVIYYEDFKSSVYTIPDSFRSNHRGKTILVLTVILGFIIYNFYSVYIEEQAISYFKLAYISHDRNDFRVSLQYFPLAINLWSSNSYFHYEYGGALLDYATSDASLNFKNRISILQKAKEEFNTAIQMYSSKIECNKLISIADYEMGDTVEAETIKKQLLDRDSLMINYRLTLTEYYIKKKYYENAKEELIFSSKYLPGSPVISKLTAALLNDKNFPDPEQFCRKLIALDPGNTTAGTFLKMKQ